LLNQLGRRKNRWVENSKKTPKKNWPREEKRKREGKAHRFGKKKRKTVAKCQRATQMEPHKTPCGAANPLFGSLPNSTIWTDTDCTVEWTKSAWFQQAGFRSNGAD
jgi:hypothetical protein